MQPSDDAQKMIDPFIEMNRYDDRHEEWPSDAVYAEPRRTVYNDWQKFHAARDCGRKSVYYAEHTSWRVSGDKYEYKLRCSRCGYDIPEDEVLFIGGQWFHEHGWTVYHRMLDDLFIPPERVLELGPDPDQDELLDALNLTRIEGEASIHGITFGEIPYQECSACEHDALVLFDGQCRMCYDGEWTERMQHTVEVLGRGIRERNGSFVHRLESHVDPLSIHDRAFKGSILWRRHDEENVPKLVEVTQCLKDDDTGEWEYILMDMTHTSEWRYHEADLASCFWDTGLDIRGTTKPIEDDRIRDICQHLGR